jgi:hypothetical protein
LYPSKRELGGGAPTFSLPWWRFRHASHNGQIISLALGEFALAETDICISILTWRRQAQFVSDWTKTNPQTVHLSLTQFVEAEDKSIMKKVKQRDGKVTVRRKHIRAQTCR